MGDVEVEMAVGEVPDLLMVDEVARVLRIGRTTAYQEVNRFVATGGRAGIPVIVVGGQKRIPRVRLEAMIGGPVHVPPPSVRLAAPAEGPAVVDLRDRRTTAPLKPKRPSIAKATLSSAVAFPIDLG